MPSPATAPLTEICAGIRLSKEARALLNDALPPVDYVRLLQKQSLISDAIHVLARLFAKREAVWWACQCARGATPDELPRPEAEALAATEAWVADPSEKTRSGLMAVANAAGMETPAGCAAFAAFGSSGSLAPAEYAPMPPKETLTAELSAASILAAGAVEDPEKAIDKYKVFLEQGIGLYESRGS